MSSLLDLQVTNDEITAIGGEYRENKERVIQFIKKEFKADSLNNLEVYFSFEQRPIAILKIYREILKDCGAETKSFIKNSVRNIESYYETVTSYNDTISKFQNRSSPELKWLVKDLQEIETIYRTHVMKNFIFVQRYLSNVE